LAGFFFLASSVFCHARMSSLWSILLSKDSCQPHSLDGDNLRLSLDFSGS
jgi:hypothetical protein